jgi:hypothetical protein
MSDVGRDSVGQHDEATEKEGEPRQRHKRASAAALIDAFIDEYRTDREGHNRRENHRVAREWLTIVGLFFAAGFAFLQWLELGRTDKNIERQANLIGEQLKAMNTQADAARRSADAIELNQRAWLSPINARLKSPLKADETPTFLIDVQNVGREPAFDATYRIADGLIAIPQTFSDWTMLPVGENDLCDKTLPLSGNPTIFPGSGLSNSSLSILYIVAAPTQFSTPISNIIEKKAILFVRGCIAYTSVNKTRHTAFCNYIEPNSDPPAAWPIKSCPKGSKAT